MAHLTFAQGARLRWCDIDPCPLEWAHDNTLVEGPPLLPPSCVVYPNGHKGAQRRKCGSFTIDTMQGCTAADSTGKFLTGLPTLLSAYRSAGYYPTPMDSIFPQCSPGRSRLLPAVPLTGGGLRQVLRRLHARQPDGSPRFTAHSFRRGRMIQDKHDGVSPSVTCDRALNMSMQNYRRYTNELRPTLGGASSTPASVASAPAPP